MFTRKKVVMHEKLDVWVFLDILGNISLSLFFFFPVGGAYQSEGVSSFCEIPDVFSFLLF